MSEPAPIDEPKPTSPFAISILDRDVARIAAMANVSIAAQDKRAQIDFEPLIFESSEDAFSQVQKITSFVQYSTQRELSLTSTVQKYDSDADTTTRFKEKVETLHAEDGTPIFEFGESPKHTTVVLTSKKDPELRFILQKGGRDEDYLTSPRISDITKLPEVARLFTLLLGADVRAIFEDAGQQVPGGTYALTLPPPTDKPVDLRAV